MKSWRVLALIVGAWLAIQLGGLGVSTPAFGSGSCTVTACNAAEPTCSTKTTYGTNNCGSTCYKRLTITWTGPTPTCDAPTTTQTNNCGETRTLTVYNPCNAPAPSCGQTTTGTYLCGGACPRTGPACATWSRYGFTVPGDPVYGFPQVKDGSGKPAIPDPNTTTLLGMAAKGNIIVGDYTSDAFKANVLPNIKPGIGSKTQPYVIDPTDANLGYHTGVEGKMTDTKNRPLFDGNYDQQDKNGLAPGEKLDGTPRKFYESTLSDAAFKSKVLMPTSGTMTIDGVLYTNHALAGLSLTSTMVNGALVGRDDGILVNGQFTINHDTRLLGGSAGQDIVLPLSIKRPALKSWQDCAALACQ